MRVPWFIGDALTAAGFRLAGARVAVPDPGHEGQLFQQACEDADLVLVTAEIAERIPAKVLREASLSGEPLVLVVPDARGRAAPPDPAAGLRRQLGLSE